MTPDIALTKADFPCDTWPIVPINKMLYINNNIPILNVAYLLITDSDVHYKFGIYS